MRRVLVCIVLLFCGLLLDINAQSRLYPGSSSVLKDYYQQVDELLLNGGEFNDFAFEIRPSFSGESGCWYDNKDSVLVLRNASHNIWYSFSVHNHININSLNNKKKKHSKAFTVTEYRCPLSKESAHAFRNLFIAATFSSSHLAKPYGADGVTYQIYIGGGAFTAECWSPNDKSSNCGKLVELLTCLKMLSLIINLKISTILSR